jgi:hypothetical protein
MVSTTGVDLSGDMWLSFWDSDDLNSTVPPMLQYTNPSQLMAGSNMFGLIEIAERREISPSLLDMMGFTPVCGVPVPLLPLSVDVSWC